MNMRLGDLTVGDVLNAYLGGVVVFVVFVVAGVFLYGVFCFVRNSNKRLSK
jgi:hypothetical protein